MLEIERVSFVEHYHQQIQDALSERYYDFKTGRSQLIYQFGDVISAPDNAELGTIYRITKLKRDAEIHHNICSAYPMRNPGLGSNFFTIYGTPSLTENFVRSAR